MPVLWLVLAGALGGCGGGQGSGETPDGRRAEAGRFNVVLIVLDALRADHLGLYGYDQPTSPNLDALGARSFVLDQMIATAPWTKPSVASLFTSLYPQDHRAVLEGTECQLAESLTTLAERFHEAGYRTAAFSENPHIHPDLGFGQGFDEFEARTYWGGGSKETTDSICRWLTGGPASPFFLYVHYLDPHAPYAPPEPYRTRFLQGQVTKREAVEKGLPNKLLDDHGQAGGLAPSDADYLRALYDAEIGSVDASVGRVLEALGTRGLADQTIVIVTSDHGEEFTDHGSLEHGRHLYEESIHVPFIMHLPGMSPLRDHQTVAQHIDIAPTLLDLVGLEIPAAFCGRSLRPILEDGDWTPRPALSQTEWRNNRRKGVRSPDWKLIDNLSEKSLEVYHLARDPAEKHNEAGKHQKLEERMQRMMTLLVRPTLSEAVNARGQRNERLEGLLEGLGYTGGDESGLAPHDERVPQPTGGEPDPGGAGR